LMYAKPASYQTKGFVSDSSGSTDSNLSSSSISEIFSHLARLYDI